MFLLVESEAAGGEAVNLCSTNNIQIRALAEEIRNQLPPDLDLEFAERYDADYTHTDTTKG